MTGIERLRELIENYRAGNECEGIECGALSFGKCMANNVLKPIADQIERERAEDAESVAWVREHGGLGHVKDICHDFRAVVERLGIEWSESELHGLMDVLDKRLMPEGMEDMIASYPRFEDGTLALPGMEAVANSGQRSGEAFTIKKAWLENGTWHLSDSTSDGHYWHFKHKDPVVRRPAPKVLDADGVEIRVGDTVWFVDESLEDFRPHIISEVKNDLGLLKTETVRFEDCAFPYPASSVTHRAPVLAADGKPLREGETVWSADSGTRYTVEKITDEIIPIKCRSEMGSTVSLHPSQLTHERPVVDTWERLEEDARNIRTAMLDSEKLPFEVIDERALDLVRRARALVERDA